MNITRDNYESWFLDFLEGNLKEGMVDEFLQFIRENPDLREELDLCGRAVLEPADLKFPDRKKLYREIYDVPGVFDETAAGMIEGDLDPSGEKSFESYLETHPEKNRDLEFFRLAKLSPDFTVVFRNKNLLHRRPVIRLATLSLLRIAAVFAFILSLWLVLEEQPSYRNPVKTLNILTADNGPIIQNNVPEIKSSPYTQPESHKTILPLSEKTEVKPMAEKTGLSAVASVKSMTPEIQQREEFSSLLSVAENVPVPLILQKESGLHLNVITDEQFAVAGPDNSFISDKIIEKIGGSGISFNKVFRWGLSVASKISKDRFGYVTDPSGEIVALTLDTRLLGVSVPVNHR